MFPIILLFSAFTLISAGTDCGNFKVKPIAQLPKAYLDTVDKNFYKKFVDANGIPIMGPKGISDYTLKECARIIKSVSSDLKDGFLQKLIEKKQRIALWAADSNACSIPEVTKPCTLKDFKGGLAFGNILILQETSFKCDNRGNAWIGRVLIHEFSHAVNFVFDKVNADLQKSLDDAYKNAKSKHIWPPGEYGMSSVAEYFPLGEQPWFEANEKSSCDAGVCNRHQLRAKDKQLYDVVSRVFKPNWVYKCSDQCNRH